MKINYLIASIMLCTFFLFYNSCSSDEIILNITHPAAFVVNGSSKTISVIDLTYDTKVHDIGLNGATYPHHIYLSPDKSKLAVAITSTDLSAGHGGHGGGAGSYKVQIINSVTGIIEKEIALTKLPHNAVFNPSGSELWIPQADTPSQVLIYRTTDWTKLNEITVGHLTSEITFASDGSKVYATNTDEGSISVINPITKTVEAVISVGISPVGAWPAKNGKMYVDNETSKTVCEIDVATNIVTSTINLGFKPGYVAYNELHAELWVSDTDNGKVVYYKLIAGVWTKDGEIITGADAHAIVFTADESKAYVTNQGAGKVSVIDLTTHYKIKDILVGNKPNGIALKQ